MIKELLIYISVYLGLFVGFFYLFSVLDNRKLKKPKIPEKLPFVSVIIPAFNEEKGIQGSIKNALKLDYPKDKIEIIVVDDGSKDKTYEKALVFQKNKNVKVYKLTPNKGKGHAMNYGIKKSKGEIIFTMDADNTLPMKDSVKKMVSYFNRPEVMCVAPGIAIHNPKGILQRVQQIEYLFGIFLRKAFSSVNAVHITPGAFSAYRKSFFDKYGGFEEGNLTEDMEMALRIQYYGYVIENNPEAVVYAIAPNKFVDLMKQRRRWYGGLVKNLIKYKNLFSKDYGVLGTLVLPVAIFSILVSMVLTSWITITTIGNIRSEYYLWKSVDFNILGSIDFSRYLFEAYIINLITSPIILFFILMVGILMGYLYYAKTKVKKHSNIKLSIFFFLIFFSFLFSFWWFVTTIYLTLNKKISWR